MRVRNENGTLDKTAICGHEINSGDRFGVKVIAVFYGDCWCAYSGSTDLSDSAIARGGDEVLYEVAKLLFPTLANNCGNYYNP